MPKPATAAAKTASSDHASELSSAGHGRRNLTARPIATEAADAMWRDMGARSRTEARAFFLSHYRRRWGLLAAREYARHR